MTEITFNRKPVKTAKFEVHEQLMWIRFILEDGTQQDTYVFKGDV